jgi:hypothetical protein
MVLYSKFGGFQVSMKSFELLLPSSPHQTRYVTYHSHYIITFIERIMLVCCQPRPEPSGRLGLEFDVVLDGREVLKRIYK